MARVSPIVYQGPAQSTAQNALITDYLSQTDTTAQAIASDVTFAAGKRPKADLFYFNPSSAPANTEGYAYYDSTAKALKLRTDVAWKELAVITEGVGTYVFPPTFRIVKTGSTYDVMNAAGSFPYTDGSAIGALQYCHTNLPSSGGTIWIPPDLDAVDDVWTITKGNLAVDSGLHLGQEGNTFADSNWWRVPRIGRVVLDSTAAEIRNIKLAGFNTRGLDFYANGNAISHIKAEGLGFRPNTASTDGIRFRGASISYYVHINGCTMMDFMDQSTEHRGGISIETSTNIGTGQLWFNDWNYKHRADNSVMLAGNGYLQHLMAFKNMSYVCFGNTGCNMIKFSNHQLSPVYISDSYLECHDPETIILIDNMEGELYRVFKLFYNSNRESSGDDAGDDVIFLDNNAHTDEWASWEVSGIFGGHNQFGAVGTGGDWSIGSLGECDGFQVDLGYIYNHDQVITRVLSGIG